MQNIKAANGANKTFNLGMNHKNIKVCLTFAVQDSLLCIWTDICAEKRALLL